MTISLRLFCPLAACLALAGCGDSAKPDAAKPTPTPPAASSVTATAPASPAAKSGDAERPNLGKGSKYDVADTVNAKIRRDVMDRVDQLPNLRQEERNKLYASVDRARGMGCVLVVPFLEGKRVLADAERKVLVNSIKSEAVQKLVDDPSLVFIVIGYADEGADGREQIRLSSDRAESVISTMRELANVTNTIYPAAMGPSDAKQKAAPGAGRVAEIWAVFP